MIDLKELARIIHLTPARQNQVCFRAEIQGHDWGAEVTLQPTLDFFDQGKTPQSLGDDTYKSMLYHAGLATASIEFWAQSQGLRVEVWDQIQDLTRSDDNLRTWLWTNQDALMGYMARWIRRQRDLKTDLFQDYDYDMNKCVRDFGFLLEAMDKDLAMNTDHNTRSLADFYWDHQGQPVSRRAQELAIHRELRAWIAAATQSQPETHRQQLLAIYDGFIQGIDQRSQSTKLATKNDLIRIRIYE